MKKIQILQEIEKLLGKKVFIVGGAVRDILLKKKPKDIDIASSVTPDEVIEKLSVRFKIIPTGIEHGTVTIVDTVNGFETEHTTFRKDVETDGRKAVVEFSNSIEDDLSRRDFTINAMAVSLDGKLIDPFGGRRDIEKRRIIRTVGNPEKRFQEDFLRIIRAARFATVLGFKIDDETLTAMKKLSHLVEDNVSPERIRGELTKAEDPFLAGWLAHLGIWEDLTSLWFKIKSNPINLMVELAINSDIQDLDKYRFTSKEKRLVNLFKHAVNGRFRPVYSARNQPNVIKQLKDILKRYDRKDLANKVDKAIKIKPTADNPKDIVQKALNNL